MKHIRTEWGDVRYTVELTEEERAFLLGLVSLYGNGNRPLLDALRALVNTHP